MIITIIQNGYLYIMNNEILFYSMNSILFTFYYKIHEFYNLIFNFLSIPHNHNKLYFFFSFLLINLLKNYLILYIYGKQYLYVF